MLNIIYGADTNALREELRARLLGCIKSDGKAYMLVPEQFSVASERNLIERFGVKAQKNIEVLTFSRLCRSALSRLGPLRMDYIDGAGKRIIAERTLQVCGRNLTILRANAGQRGFAAVLADTVSEFKRYGFTPDKIRAASEAAEDEELKAKLSDLSTLIEEYQKILDDLGADADDDLAMVCGKLRDNNFFKGDIYISEFKSFTPVELEILEILMKDCDCTAFLCCDDLKNPSAPFASAADTFRRLCEAAGAANGSIEKPLRLESKDGEPELRYLRENYFNIKAEPHSEKPKRVHIYAPRNYYNEIEVCVDLIRKLCRTEGYRQSDFLVLARNIENYDRIAPALFERAGLNVFLDKRRNILSNPCVKTLLTAAEILAYGFSYDRVMAVARYGFTGLERGDIDIFDNYLLASNPGHKMWRSSEDWEYNPNIRVFDMEEINRIRRALLDPLNKLVNSIKGGKNVGMVCSAFIDFIKDNKFEEKIKEKCAAFANRGLNYTAEEYRRAWNAAISIFAQLSELMGDTEITYVKFLELLESACSNAEIAITPQTLDAVTFSEIDRFRAESVKVAIVLGVNEDVFPKGYSSEGLITDAERNKLRRLGAELAMTGEGRMVEEQNLIYNVISSASEHLYLFSPATDKDGGELLKSQIIGRIQNDLFPKIKPVVPKSGGEIEFLEYESAAFSELLTEIAKRGGEIDELPKAHRELYEYFKDSPKYSKRLERVISSVTRSRSGAKKISPETAERLYGKNTAFSVSRLEKYNSCAFSYFMRYGLLASPRETANFESKDMGSALHEILKRYFEELKNDGADYSKIDKDECRARINKIADETAKESAELLYENSAYYKYMTMRMADVSHATAWEIIRFYRNSDFRPYGFEMKIGSGGEIPPMFIDTKNGRIRINGFIDRADSVEIDGVKYMSVIDYKSSPRGLDKKLAEDGVRFQPLVYADALTDGSDNTKAAALLYMGMNDPIVEADSAPDPEELDIKKHESLAMDGWLVSDGKLEYAFDKSYDSGKKKKNFVPFGTESLLTGEEMEKRLSEAKEKIKESVEGIFSGDIDIKPYISSKYDACRFCNYYDACGYKPGRGN